MKSLTGRMLVASLALAALVAAAFALLIFEIRDLRSDTGWARHSETVLTGAADVEQLVFDLETGQRGFIITRDPRFLEPWHSARRKLRHGAPEELEHLVRDNPKQERRAQAISAAITSYGFRVQRAAGGEGAARGFRGRRSARRRRRGEAASGRNPCSVQPLRRRRA